MRGQPLHADWRAFYRAEPQGGVCHLLPQGENREPQNRVCWAGRGRGRVPAGRAFMGGLFQGKESGCQVPGGQSWWGSGSSSAVWGHEETQELATRACGASNDNNVPVECAFFKLHSSLRSPVKESNLRIKRENLNK